MKEKRRAPRRRQRAAYAKSAGGWAKTGSLKGPAGADGPHDTLKGVRWFAFALTATFGDAPSLITSQTYTPTSSAAATTSKR